MSTRTRAWIITLAAGIAVAAALPAFFAFIATRVGYTPPEPLLDQLEPRDVSGLLFGVLYAAVIIGIALLLRHPDRLLRGLQAYVLLLLLRMLSMALVPLAPPADLVSLHDPITQLFYPTTEPFTKDLFFSGHTATVFLLCMAVPGGRWRVVYLIITAFIAGAVLMQHVHWTIDVVAAPFAAWLAWWASSRTISWSLANDP